MPDSDRFDQKIQISLQRDEAIVLLTYLSRELWMQDASRLTAGFEHPAEEHGLRALLQELVHALMDTGGSDSLEIQGRARENLASRFR